MVILLAHQNAIHRTFLLIGGSFTYLVVSLFGFLTFDEGEDLLNHHSEEAEQDF